MQVAKAMAAAGCRVIITSRSLESGNAAAAEIASSANVSQVDYSS